MAVFGGDAQAVVENVTRPRGDERKPEQNKAAGSPAAPEVQDVPRPDADQSI